MGKPDKDILALQKKLTKLGDKVARKVTRQAVNAAATPVVKAAKANVAVDSGLLKKSLGKKTITSKDKQFVSALVGAKKSVQGESNGKIQKPSRYAHLVEKGFIDAAGNHVPPQPFMRPAADSTASQAESIMAKKFADGVEREARKAA
jgi:HK97 gp10 family phage protein